MCHEELLQGDSQQILDIALKFWHTNDGVWCHAMKDFMGKWIPFSDECNSYVQYFNTLNCRLWASESTNVTHKISFHSPQIIACRDFTPCFIIAPILFKGLMTNSPCNVFDYCTKIASRILNFRSSSTV